MIHDLVSVHPTSVLDNNVSIGPYTKIWHFCHISKGTIVGSNCVFGQNVFTGEDVCIGNNVKIQNNVAIYSGCRIDDDVFLGPSCVLTNITNPRSQVNRQTLYEVTHFKRGATVGANATIVSGISVGKYSFIGAGSVVTKNVPDYALMLGNPAKQKGWMSRHGHRLLKADINGVYRCPESDYRYKLKNDVMSCLDLDEESPLPDRLTTGTTPYNDFKKNI